MIKPTSSPERGNNNVRLKYIVLTILLATAVAGGSVALALQISLDSPATLPSDI
jgi:hypothetical protein